MISFTTPNICIMKKVLITLVASFMCLSGYSQYLIDNGALTDGIDYVLEGSMWNKTTLTYYIENTSAHLSATVCEQAIDNAFNTWQSNSTLSFTRVYSSDADIKVKWATGNHGDGHPFDGQYGVLAHAFYPYPSGGSYAGQLHFDDDENWSVNGTGIDVESVALHEIGHLLGISHSTISTAVMYPYYSNIKRELDSDDIEAIWNLYGNSCSISGPTVPELSSVYTIPNLPSIFSVTWNYSGSTMTTASMTTNSPSQNQCTISNPNKEYIKGTLTATIWHDSSIIATQSKAIDNGIDISGYYSQSACNLNNSSIPESYGTFNCGDTIVLYKGATINLSAPQFTYATVTYTGTSIKNWSHIGNTISFEFRNFEIIDPYVPQFTRPDLDLSQIKITGNYDNNYNSWEFWVRALPPLPNTRYPLTNEEADVSISALTSTITVTAPAEGSELSIVNSLTGQVVYKGIIDKAITISTNNWPKSTYVVMVRKSENKLYKKVNINR